MLSNQNIFLTKKLLERIDFEFTLQIENKIHRAYSILYPVEFRGLFSMNRLQAEIEKYYLSKEVNEKVLNNSLTEIKDIAQVINKKFETIKEYRERGEEYSQKFDKEGNFYYTSGTDEDYEFEGDKYNFQEIALDDINLADYSNKVFNLLSEVLKAKKAKQFSILEWASIFFYADTTKLLSNDPTIKTRIEKFMGKYKIETSFENFKNSYSEAKRRINKIQNFPIKKLKCIIPFLNENYPQAVAKVENDITFLEENTPDY